MSDHVKPCPHCGGTGEIREGGAPYFIRYCYQDCNEIRQDGFATIEAAVDYIRNSIPCGSTNYDILDNAGAVVKSLHGADECKRAELLRRYVARTGVSASTELVKTSARRGWTGPGACPECGDSGWAAHPQNGRIRNPRRCSRGCPSRCSICYNPECDNPDGQH